MKKMLKKLSAGLLTGCLLLQGLPALTAMAASKVAEPLDEAWQMTWYDNFDGTSLDTTKWGYHKATYDNGETSYYEPDNATVSQGKLTLLANSINDQYNPDGKAVTSAAINTKGKFSQTFGRFEARIKMPISDEGFWPAFWMMPEDMNMYGAWPLCGELDIMENSSIEQTKVHGTIHYAGANGKYTNAGLAYDIPESGTVDEYHEYALEWEPTELRWYIDGYLMYTRDTWSTCEVDDPLCYSFPAPFDRDFYMILNLATGGWIFTNNKTPKAENLPDKMMVDYVRVYEKDSYKMPVVGPEAYPDDAIMPEPITDAAGNVLKDEDGNTRMNWAVGNDYLNDKGEPYIRHVNTPPYDKVDSTDPSCWNLLNLADYGGEADATVETIDGVNYAKINVTTPGTEGHSVQLIRPLTITKGHTYRISFDAKADIPHTIWYDTKGPGSIAQAWQWHGGTDAALTTEFQHFQCEYTMNYNTFNRHRLEFNIGNGETGNVWIGNVVVEDIPETPDTYGELTDRDAQKNGSLIWNGTFDHGASNRQTFWKLNIVKPVGFDNSMGAENPYAAVKVPLTNKEAQVSVNNADKLVRFETTGGTKMNRNGQYTVKFQASAEKARDITLYLRAKDVLNEKGKVVTEGGMLDARTVSVTTDKKEYTVTMSVPDSFADTHGVVGFSLGGTDGKVFFDNITMIESENSNGIAERSKLSTLVVTASSLNAAKYKATDMTAVNGMLAEANQMSAMATAQVGTDALAGRLEAKLKAMGIADPYDITIPDFEDGVLGDIDGSGVVDTSDLVKLAKHVAGIPGAALTGTAFTLADVNCDNSVDTSDLVMIARHVAGIAVTFGPKA